MPKNLPVIVDNRIESGLALSRVNDNPVVAVLGTAAQGDTENLYPVVNLTDAASTFGKSSGTLIRGMYEASSAGALNIKLFRIGATSAKLVGVGKTATLAGFTIETIKKDSSAGTDYKLTFDVVAVRLRVYRASDDTLVYDNNPADPLNAVDLGEVIVSGTAGDGSPTYGDIGTPANGAAGAITLAAAADAYGVGQGPVFTAGTDGLNLSRMQMFEALHRAYSLLEDQDLDVIVPMDVYLDDKSVTDLAAADVAALGLNTLTTYPTAGTSTDVLGLVYTEEFEGEQLFWWWFPSDPAAARDATFTTDGGADIFPSVGAATATTKADGSALTGSDFHEANFAYQLADFCFRQSRDFNDMTGVIGVLPPASFSLKDVSKWIGSAPVVTTDASGNDVVSTNGTGLLGNKWMAGRVTAGGVVGHTVGGIDGLAGGGFIATASGWPDGQELKDVNDRLVDIGKYISVVAAWPLLSNASRASAYAASGAPTYAGFYSALAPASAPTHKVLDGLRLPFRVGLSKADLLAGTKYVVFIDKRRGVTIADAPTAARHDSDYQRLSTVRQVKAAIDAVRRVGDPFLGEGLTGARLAALDTAIDNELRTLVKRGVISRYEHQVSSTPAQRVQGQALVELKLVPAFELREITVNVTLSAV